MPGACFTHSAVFLWHPVHSAHVTALILMEERNFHASGSGGASQIGDLVMSFVLSTATSGGDDSGWIF
jgi:hypothetical protein